MIAAGAGPAEAADGVPRPADASAAQVDVSIVMPCLDESLTLPHCMEIAQETLARLRGELGLSGEIVVSDNGSTDGSQALAGELGARVVHCPHRGYGNALIFGIRHARGRMIVMGDSDGSYDFRDAIPMVARLLDGYDLCMGSRLRGEIKPGAMPWKNRYIGNPLLTGILNLFFRSGLSDAHCGLRAFTRETFLRLNLTSAGMEFASEMVVKSALLGLRRTEVPITLYPDRRDRPPHLRPWRDGWRHLRYLVMLTPLWLYFLPAGLLALMSAVIFSLLLRAPAGAVVPLGPVWIGDHWIVLAGGFATGSHLAFLFGLMATVVGIRERYRRATGAIMFLYRMSRLEPMLILGSFLCTAGAALLGSVVIAWSETNFGGLSRMREMVLATTLFILGVQSVFVGFFLSLIAPSEGGLERLEDAGASAGHHAR